MREGKDKQIRELMEDGPKPSNRVNEEDPSPAMEKTAPEEMKKNLDDLFRSYVFGEG